MFFCPDKCISIRFYNKILKPVRIVSSMKRAGYLVTAETFKLKTIFKHARKDRKVHFYAQDLDDKEDILLNNNNVITVIPGPCDLPYRSIYLSKNGQFTNDGNINTELLLFSYNIIILYCYIDTGSKGWVTPFVSYNMLRARCSRDSTFEYFLTSIRNLFIIKHFQLNSQRKGIVFFVLSVRARSQCICPFIEAL